MKRYRQKHKANSAKYDKMKKKKIGKKTGRKKDRRRKTIEWQQSKTSKWLNEMENAEKEHTGKQTKNLMAMKKGTVHVTFFFTAHWCFSVENHRF